VVGLKVFGQRRESLTAVGRIGRRDGQLETDWKGAIRGDLSYGNEGRKGAGARRVTMRHGVHCPTTILGEK
jgi:hypothetical protein